MLQQVQSLLEQSEPDPSIWRNLRQTLRALPRPEGAIDDPVREAAEQVLGLAADPGTRERWSGALPGADWERLWANLIRYVASWMVAAECSAMVDGQAAEEVAEDLLWYAALACDPSRRSGAPTAPVDLASTNSNLQPVTVADRLFDELAQRRCGTSGARLWTLYWLAAARQTPQVRLPVVCVDIHGGLPIATG